MLSVSSSFKNAIKSQNREIFGYIDIKYQDSDFNTEITQIPSNLNIVASDGVLNGEKTMQKYATLENNYTLLDNSFIVWNENTILKNGYISNDVFENINDNTIVITNNSTNISTKGITIYFKENLPFNFNVTITDMDGGIINDIVTNNQSYVYQYIFSEEKFIDNIVINILNVEFPKNRLRIAYIDFNLSDLYEGDELISFDVNEELDLLVEKLPINTCNININNYPTPNGGNKFDPINPKGITKYLTDDVTIEPYIGVMTEDNGIEYVKMGMFYLNNWDSNSDANVTFSGSSVLNKLKGKEMVWNSSMFSPAVYTPALATMIQNTANIKCLFPEYSMPIDNWSNIHTKLFDYLDYISPCLLYNNKPNLSIGEIRKIYVNRYNNIVIDNISTTIVDNIDRHSLTTDVKYTTNKPIQDITVDYTVTSSSSGYSAETILNIPYTLSKPVEYVWFNTDKYIVSINSIQGNVSTGSASLTYIGNNMHLIHVKLTGTVGSVINITCNANVANNSSNNKYTSSFADNTITNGDTININFGDCEIPNVDAIKDVFFDLDKPYKVTAKTIGDPSLEIGDSIAIQTRYTDINNGYKNIIITKQHFSFNGSLQCEIEGLGD